VIIGLAVGYHFYKKNRQGYEMIGRE